MYYSFAYKNDGILFESWKPVAIAFDVTRRYFYCSAPIPDHLLPSHFNSRIPFGLAYFPSLPIISSSGTASRGPSSTTTANPPQSSHHSHGDRKPTAVPSPSQLQWTVKLKLHKVRGACEQILLDMFNSELKERQMYEVEITGLKRKLAKTEFPPPEPLLCPSTSLAGDVHRCRLDNKEFIEDPFFQRELFEGLHDVFSAIRLDREAREVAEAAAAAGATDGSSSTGEGNAVPTPPVLNPPPAPLPPVPSRSRRGNKLPSLLAPFSVSNALTLESGTESESHPPPIGMATSSTVASRPDSTTSPHFATFPRRTDGHRGDAALRSPISPPTGSPETSFGNRSEGTEAEGRPAFTISSTSFSSTGEGGGTLRASSSHIGSQGASLSSIPPHSTSGASSRPPFQRQRFRTLDSPTSLAPHRHEEGRGSGEESGETENGDGGGSGIASHRRGGATIPSGRHHSGGAASGLVAKPEAVKRELIRFDTMQSYVRFLYVVRHVLGFDRLMFPPHFGLPPLDPRNGLRLTPLPLYLWHQCRSIEMEALYYCGYGVLARRPSLAALDHAMVYAAPSTNGMNGMQGNIRAGHTSESFPTGPPSSFLRFGSSSTNRGCAAGGGYEKGNGSTKEREYFLCGDHVQRRGHFTMLNESIFFLHSQKSHGTKQSVECVRHFYDIQSVYYASSLTCELPCIIFIMRRPPPIPSSATGLAAEGGDSSNSLSLPSHTMNQERIAGEGIGGGGADGTGRYRDPLSDIPRRSGAEGAAQEEEDTAAGGEGLEARTISTSLLSYPSVSMTTTAAPYPVLSPSNRGGHVEGDVLFIPQRPQIGGSSLPERRYPLYRPDGVVPPSYYHHLSAGGMVQASSPQTAFPGYFPSMGAGSTTIPGAPHSTVSHPTYPPRSATHGAIVSFSTNSNGDMITSSTMARSPTFPTSSTMGGFPFPPPAPTFAGFDQMSLEEQELLCLEVERMANVVEHFSLSSIDIQPVIDIVPLPHVQTIAEFLTEVASRIGRPLVLDYCKAPDRPRGPQLPGIWSSYRVRATELAEQQLRQQNLGNTPVGGVPAVPIYFNHLNEVPLTRDQVMELEEYAAMLQEHWREVVPPPQPERKEKGRVRPKLHHSHKENVPSSLLRQRRVIQSGNAHPKWANSGRPAVTPGTGVDSEEEIALEDDDDDDEDDDEEDMDVGRDSLHRGKEEDKGWGRYRALGVPSAEGTGHAEEEGRDDEDGIQAAWRHKKDGETAAGSKGTTPLLPNRRRSFPRRGAGEGNGEEEDAATTRRPGSLFKEEDPFAHPRCGLPTSGSAVREGAVADEDENDAGGEHYRRPTSRASRRSTSLSYHETLIGFAPLPAVPLRSPVTSSPMANGMVGGVFPAPPLRPPSTALAPLPPPSSQESAEADTESVPHRRRARVVDGEEERAAHMGGGGGEREEEGAAVGAWPPSSTPLSSSTPPPSMAGLPLVDVSVPTAMRHRRGSWGGEEVLLPLASVLGPTVGFTEDAGVEGGGGGWGTGHALDTVAGVGEDASGIGMGMVGRTISMHGEENVEWDGWEEDEDVPSFVQPEAQYLPRPSGIEKKANTSSCHSEGLEVLSPSRASSKRLSILPKKQNDMKGEEGHSKQNLSRLPHKKIVTK